MSKGKEVQRKDEKRCRVERGCKGAQPEEGRGEEGSDEVTFGDQRLFVVTFSHLCSSLTQALGSFVTCFPNKLGATWHRCICCPQLVCVVVSLSAFHLLYDIHGLTTNGEK